MNRCLLNRVENPTVDKMSCKNELKAISKG